MTRRTQLPGASPHSLLRLVLVVSCASAFLISGCAQREVKAKNFPWSTFANTRPLAPDVAAAEVEEDDPFAEATLGIAPPPSALVAVRSAPPRPRVAAGSSAQTDTTSKPQVPQIAPQLTPAEISSAQQQTGQSLGAAERNIATAEGKTLNATQLDLASKVRSFVAEAREAAQIGDWTRARNAAKKAEVLSQELANSL